MTADKGATDPTTEVSSANADLDVDPVHAARFLDAIIENIPDMIFVKDAERLAFKRFNRAGERLLGVARAELLGKNDFDFFPEEQARFFQEKDRNTLVGKALVEIEEEPIETANGRRWLHTKKVPVLDENGTPIYLLGISEDITERKQEEDARRRLAALVDSSSDGILSMTMDHVITTWNNGAQALFGYTAAEAIGKPVSILLPPAQDDDLLGIVEKLKRGESVPSYEAVRRASDGRDLDVSVSTFLIHNKKGEVIGLSKIIRDITELKRAEAAATKARDEAQTANRELEAFSYSVAHDLRAPLRAIDGFSQALLEDCGDALNDEGKQHLDRVRKSAQHMAELIDALLALSRVTRSELVRATVDIGALARESLDLLQRTNPLREVEVKIQEGLLVSGDARLLGAVIENLVSNAWKFTAKRTHALIEVGSTNEAGRRAFYVRDNGAGFDMSYAAKLFGVFQRLHSAAEFDGTGVGLATVQRILRRHGGYIWAEALPNVGATFYFTLGEAAPTPDQKGS